MSRPLRTALGLSALLLASGCATASPDPVHPPMVHTAPEGPDRVVDPVADRLAPPDGISVFTAEGEPLLWSELVERTGEVEVVLLGEIHDDEVGHRARHALTAARVAADDELAISLEMFEADVQLVLDEYLAGLITEDQFLSAARPWDNYRSGYRAYIEMARAEGVPVIAANTPRRYANIVSRVGLQGLDELTSDALRWLPPLPYPGPSAAYRAQWDALMGAAGAHGTGDADEGERMLLAQALWDASMGWAIAEALDRSDVSRVIHVAGAFHIEAGTGVPELLSHYRPGTSTLTVVAYPVEPGVGFDPEEHGGLGDVIILSPR